MNIPTITEKDLGRFFSKVDPNGPIPIHAPEIGRCHIWTASTFRSGGYGVFKVGPRKCPPFRAHRIAWFIANGSLDPKIQVLHRCDNPPCVNPDHLFSGTAADNISDCVKKDRHGRGDRNGNSILNAEKVAEIRRLYAEGEITQKHLGKMFGVNRITVCNIITRRRWQHLP